VGHLGEVLDVGAGRIGIAQVKRQVAERRASRTSRGSSCPTSTSSAPTAPSATRSPRTGGKASPSKASRHPGPRRGLRV